MRITSAVQSSKYKRDRSTWTMRLVQVLVTVSTTSDSAVLPFLLKVDSDDEGDSDEDSEEEEEERPAKKAKVCTLLRQVSRTVYIVMGTMVEHVKCIEHCM